MEEKNTTTTQTMSFWTTGDAYTNLMYNMYDSGRFRTFLEMCKDGNFDKEQLILCLKRQLVLEGDTRK